MTYTWQRQVVLHPGIPQAFRNHGKGVSLTNNWCEVRRIQNRLPDVASVRVSVQRGPVQERFSPIPEELSSSLSSASLEQRESERKVLWENCEDSSSFTSANLEDFFRAESLCWSEELVRDASSRTGPRKHTSEGERRGRLGFEECLLHATRPIDDRVDAAEHHTFPPPVFSPRGSPTNSDSSPTPSKPAPTRASRSQQSFGAFDRGPKAAPTRREEKRDALCCTLSRMQQILMLQDFLREQFESLQDELERRREECIQLRTVLANRSTEQRTLAQSSYGKDVDIVNEDGEIVLALQSQKQINRQLMEELNQEKARFDESESEYRSEVRRLRQENERQQKLIGQNLMKSTGSQAETLLQSEIMRLTSENLNLQGQVDSLTEQLKKYKRTLKVYSKKLKEAGGSEPPPDLVESEVAPDRETMPVIRKKDREYMGMFEYDRREEGTIIKVLIYELKPRVAVTLLPGLPAYILFMCIRHTDHVNDDEKVRSLLNNLVNGVKRVIKKRHEDLDSTVLWLSNTLRLLHTLKQYSGEKAFQTENTPKQNEQSLKNFDLSEYRQVLSDIGVWIYNGVIKLMEEKVQPLIVPAILEHEAITGLSGNKPGGMRGRAGSVAREAETPVEPQKALDLLMKELTLFYRTLAMFGTDPEIITQVFRQIFYFICAGALNNLLLRKDMCHWSKGMQIRYNLSHLEQWTRDMRLHEAGVTDTLAPIIQAAQILQARKTDDDVNSICDMCDKLTVSQIIKILNLYTPADDYEERVPIPFIHKIQAKLQERAEGEQEQHTLLMNTKFAFPVRFPFNPSSIRLEDIELPDVLNLSLLKKI